MSRWLPCSLMLPPIAGGGGDDEGGDCIAFEIGRVAAVSVQRNLRGVRVQLVRTASSTVTVAKVGSRAKAQTENIGVALIFRVTRSTMHLVFQLKA